MRSGSFGSKYVTVRVLTAFEKQHVPYGSVAVAVDPSQRNVALARTRPCQSSRPSSAGESAQVPCQVVWYLDIWEESSTVRVPSAENVAMKGGAGGSVPGILVHVPQAAWQNAACCGESVAGSAGQGRAIPNHAPTS